MTLRVIQALGSGRPGGAENMFTRLCVGLHASALDQLVLARFNEDRFAALRAGGVEPVELPFGGLFDFSTGRGFRRAIADFSPHVVLTWMNRATRFCPAKVRNHPFVHAARMGGYYDMKYYRQCDHLVGNTRDLRDYFVREGWPAEKSHYLPNFIDARPAPAVERVSVDTPPDVPLVLALGRLHTNKAFDVLIHALADLPGVWLWIAGSGPEEVALKTLAAKLDVTNRVRFLGWRNDIAALLAACDVLAVPSRHEPLGNVVLEGWAHRVPVVAADAVGPAALIADRESGLLIAKDDTSALVKALRQVIDDHQLGDSLVSGGAAAYEADFTEAAVCRHYLDFFHQVAAP